MIGMSTSWAKLSVFGLALPLMLGVAACSSSDDGDKSGGGDPPGGGGGGSVTVESFCDHYADHLNKCDKSFEEQTYASKCKNDTASTWPKWREDVVKPADGCVQELDCATMVKGDGIGACLREASASLAPSAIAQEFCTALVDAIDKCDMTPYEKANCLNAFKYYKDAPLGDAKECAKKSCSQMIDCIDAVLPI